MFLLGPGLMLNSPRARQRFAAVVTPIIFGLHEYTGYSITLLAGRVDAGGLKKKLEVVG